MLENFTTNLNMVNNAWTWGGALAGFKHTIIGMIMTASGNQNPAYREAITKAYYQKSENCYEIRFVYVIK